MLKWDNKWRRDHGQQEGNGAGGAAPRHLADCERSERPCGRLGFQAVRTWHTLLPLYLGEMMLSTLFIQHQIG